jgi:hypothetical protein
MLKRLLFANAILFSVGAMTPAAAEMVYVPAIKWYVAGPIEWFTNWLAVTKILRNEIGRCFLWNTLVLLAKKL